MKQTEKKKITGVVVFTITAIATDLESGFKHKYVHRVGCCVSSVFREVIDSVHKRHKDDVSKIFRKAYPEGEYSLKVRISRRVVECDEVC